MLDLGFHLGVSHHKSRFQAEAQICAGGSAWHIGADKHWPYKVKTQDREQQQQSKALGVLEESATSKQQKEECRRKKVVDLDGIHKEKQ